MARLVNPGADAALRTYLLTEARDFRRTYVETQLDDPAWRDYVWADTSMRVDQLANGQPCRISRYELPHGHPARALGKISDTLLLDENDILTEVDSHPRVRA